METRPNWVNHPDLVEYYAGHRNRLDELYPSERRFLPWLARRARSVLDVGCGAGGFSTVWRSFSPALRYTGVDISAPLVDAARRLHPEHEFLQADCADHLPLGDRVADAAVALGWLHWEPRFAEALAELWRVSDRYAFFDLRLHQRVDTTTTGAQRLALTGDWDGRTTVPYICAAWPHVARLLLELRPGRILAHGYLGRPAATVRGVDGKICFATFVLERSGPDATGNPEVLLDLPMHWPDALRDEVRLADPQRLAEMTAEFENAAR